MDKVVSEVVADNDTYSIAGLEVAVGGAGGGGAGSGGGGGRSRTRKR